jgi:hypothetical protein
MTLNVSDLGSWCPNKRMDLSIPMKIVNDSSKIS